MEIGDRLQSAIEVVAICAAVLVGMAITKNPLCLWALFFAVLIA